MKTRRFFILAGLVIAAGGGTVIANITLADRYEITILTKGVYYNISALSPAQRQFIQDVELPNDKRSVSLCINNRDPVKIIRRIAGEIAQNCQVDTVTLNDGKIVGALKCTALNAKEKSNRLEFSGVHDATGITLKAFNWFDSDGDLRPNVANDITVHARFSGRCRGR